MPKMFACCEIRWSYLVAVKQELPVEFCFLLSNHLKLHWLWLASEGTSTDPPNSRSSQSTTKQVAGKLYKSTNLWLSWHTVILLCSHRSLTFYSPLSPAATSPIPDCFVILMFISFFLEIIQFTNPAYSKNRHIYCFHWFQIQSCKKCILKLQII